MHTRCRCECYCCMYIVGQTTSNNIICKLLTKVLAGIEEIKQTQKLHSAMLHSLQKQQNALSGIASQELPQNLTLPFSTYEDVDNAEEMLKDKTTQKIMVNFIVLFV